MPGGQHLRLARHRRLLPRRVRPLRRPRVRGPRRRPPVLLRARHPDSRALVQRHRPAVCTAGTSRTWRTNAARGAVRLLESVRLAGGQPRHRARDRVRVRGGRAGQRRVRVRDHVLAQDECALGLPLLPRQRQGWRRSQAVAASSRGERSQVVASRGERFEQWASVPQIRFRKRQFRKAEIYRKHTGSGDIPEADAYSSMPRCHICVTGQLQRLELSKKWDMMIHPISGFMNVTVILCLNRQTQTSHFARATARDGKMVDTYGFHGNSSYLDMPLRSFQGVTKRNGVTLHTRWVSYDELENVSIVTSRIHDQKSTRTPQVTLKRATSHLRQYYTQTWCDIGVLPDYFIKIRDDAIPLFRINWYTVLRYTRRSSKMVVTQHCASWYGLSDKIAIVGGSNHSISKYIYAPFSRYPQATPRWVMNPETYLLYVMTQEGFVQYSANLGVVTSRKMENGSRVYPRGVDKCEERWIQRAGRGAGYLSVE